MDKVNNISGWGNYPKVQEATLHTLNTTLTELITIRGNGRSYGDAAIGKNIISCLSLKKELSLDLKTGLLTCDSGILLREVLNYTIPLGYTLATIPGTQFVTIGGMIAADVHGKNHFRYGSIGNWVEELLIKVNDNEPIWCSLFNNKDLFNATIGGMGLTGLILRAKIKLIPIKSYLFEQQTLSATSIHELLKLFKTNEDEYCVAWIDLLNTNHQYLFFSGHESDPTNTSQFKLKQPVLSIPKLPFSLLSGTLMRLYNRSYYRKNKRNSSLKVDFNKFFFPLDKFNNWSRLYGKKGMIQYQFILPENNALKGFNEIIERIKKSKHQPYLSVLKKYERNTSPGIISFPLRGYSLALDFPYKEGLVSFLHQLDQKVIEYNGRIYLAKDACLEPKNIEKMYPNSTHFKSFIANYKYSSNLAKRLNLK